MDVVTDPDVLVSAVVTPRGTCAELLARLVLSPLRIVVTPLVLQEVERVLARPRFEALPAELGTRYVDYIRRVAQVEDDPVSPGATLVLEDPGDDYLVRIVLAGSDRILVSGDRHLLDLAGMYPIVTPRELLDRLP